MGTPLAGEVIATILRHDTKLTSYKLAIVRALREDVAFGFATLPLDLEQYPPAVANAVADLIEQRAAARNLPRFV